MRLLVVAGGFDRSELALHSALRESGIDVAVMCSPSAPRVAALASAGVPVIPLVLRHRLDVRAVRAVRRQIRAQRPHVIYAPTNRGLSVSLLASRGCGVLRVAYRGTMGHLSRLDPASWLTYLNPGLDSIVCVSDAVRGYLLSMGIPARRLITIYKGHDPAWYDAPPAGEVELRRLGIPRGAFVAGFTGCMRPVKGVPVLLEACRHLPPSPPIHILLVGEVRDARVRRMAKRPDIAARVHFAGYREDAVALTGACDVFVMPSVAREGLPRGVIEAMAQGLPAVVSAVGGMTELVQDGLQGRVVPPRDPRALASALAALAADPVLRRECGARARARIAEHFNIRATVEQMRTLFTGLAASRAAQPAKT